MKHHIDFKDEIDNDARVKIQQKLNEIREIRNDFAHNSAYNKDVNSEDVKKRLIILYEWDENGCDFPKKFVMKDIMDLIKIINRKVEKTEISEGLEIAREKTETSEGLEIARAFRGVYPLTPGRRLGSIPSRLLYPLTPT